MVRPAGFEPAASWFVDKVYWTQGFLFNKAASADMSYFGPFAANWVGIWVGKNQSPMVRFASDGVPVGCHSDVQALDVNATLDRLQAKGYVRSRLAEPTPERGGRSKRFFRVTAVGIAAVNCTHRAFQKDCTLLSVVRVSPLFR